MNKVEFECNCGYWWHLIFSGDGYGGWFCTIGHGRTIPTEFWIDIEQDSWETASMMLKMIQQMMGRRATGLCKFMAEERRPQVMMS